MDAAERFRQARRELAANIERTLGPFDPLHLAALVAVPREQFVREADVSRSADDVPLALGANGLATISAPHAYLLSFRLVALAPGDRLVELGSGSGYGAALASYVVGRSGSVRSFEIDPELAAWAERNHAERGRHGDAEVRIILGDGMTNTAEWGDFDKLICTFAIESVPGAWLSALTPGKVGVAPVGPPNEQKLVRFACESAEEGGRLVVTKHGRVRYVPNRGAGA
jgi:protein-L-isoaspartate(D-aspartate) O-methyltransferase